MDLKSFGPLIGALINAGSPAIGGVVTLLLTPEIGPLASLVGGGVSDILPRIAQALGAPADSTPEQITSTINADPSAAQAKLATLEEEHSSTLATLKQNQDYALANAKQQQDADVAGQAQQVALNTVEISNPSMFVAGPRPMIMWGLGGLLVMSVALPYVCWIFAQFGVALTAPPPMDRDAMVIIASLLGVVGAMRSVDKATGTAATGVGGTSKIAIASKLKK